MTPNPANPSQENEFLPRETLESTFTGDEVVISGISGVFPKSENTMQLLENLYNKVDMVEEVNFSTVQHPSLPKHYGKINNLNKFDAQFFRVTPWQAASLDPMTRKVMENAFCAIYDSGINPHSLSGSKLGVFMGASYSDITAINVFESHHKNPFIISGCSKAMMANKISYWIDAKGPSFGLEQTCSSSMACLELAYNSIKRGDCDAALVGGCNLCMHPVLSINLKIAGQVCLDGKTKCFDKNGDGFVRSEAINVLFLQKAKDAKRIYTEIYHIKGKYFTKPDANFLAIRKSEDLEQFLQEFYSEVKVSPSEVEYVEAFGLGLAEGDANELNAIGNFFTKSRSIKIGSIKSNMGNTEAANGLCSVTKLCLAYYKGKLPANLHYNEPQNHIPAVRDKRVQVVTENTPFSRGLTAVNSFSFSGCNFHLLLKGHYKRKENNRYKSNIPRLILLSGRDEYGVYKAFDELKNKPIDPEQLALIHNIYNTNIPGNTGRGYTVLDTDDKNETISLARSFEIFSGTTRPVCFLYSGMGSQWNGMGTQLLHIPIFASAIDRCDKVLKPLGVDIIKILTDSDKSIFDNILNSMVGITAMQIGLTDVLKEVGIVPNTIIGHSMGELGCAYADGCFTIEETILSSFIRGLVSIQTPFIRGSMAAVGLGYCNILPLCPPEIKVACHNSSESSTISGPADIMTEFVSDLSNRGIFAREVACSNIAYHSEYIAGAGPALLTKMKDLITNPKIRSQKWISTSVPQEKWNQDESKYASPEYFTYNLLNPVIFEENASFIPKDAIIIEIAPHGSLQAIVKKSHNECINISLTKRAAPDPVLFFLEAIGKLYECGLNPSIDVLYPKVEFPVSSETPILSHLVEWEHSTDWPENLHVNKILKQISARNFAISTHDDEYALLKGNIINGLNVLPETAFLVFVWETLAMYRGIYYQDMSVTFYNVSFHCQLKIEAKDVLRLRVSVLNASKRFEVYSGNTSVVSGFVRNSADTIKIKDSEIRTESDVIINGDNFYALLRSKGYSYGDDFQTIHSLNTTRNAAYVKCTGEWITFLDSLLQLNAFARKHEGVSAPKTIRKLSIHVEQHYSKEIIAYDNVNCYIAELTEGNNLVRCGGIELAGVIFNDKPRLNQQPDVLRFREFIPHDLVEIGNVETAVSVNIQLVANNVTGGKINVLDLLGSSEPLSILIKTILERNPKYHFDAKTVEINSNDFIQNLSNVHLIVAQNLFGKLKYLLTLKEIPTDAFILTFENNLADVKATDVKIITSMHVNGGVLVLLKKEDDPNTNITYIAVKDDGTFSWLTQVQRELKTSKRVMLVSKSKSFCGLLGFVKCLRNKGNDIGIVAIDDCNVPSFDPDDPQNTIYKKQLEKNLAFNVWKQGKWGNYYYVTKKTTAKIQNVSLSNTVEDLNSFTWIENPDTDGNYVRVSYTGLTSKYCQKVSGNAIDQKPMFAMDFSGVDSSGVQVMGMVATDAISSAVSTDPTLLWPVPTHWSLEDAATVPLPFIHAYYILVLKCKIQRNQTVFVTGGAGALGQAVISICHSLDCTVFTTVSEVKKKILLMKLFPKLKDEHIAYSRHDFFYTQIVAETNNERCDVVINCYTGILREAAMKCVGNFRKFVDVSNVGHEDVNINFGMFYLDWDKEYQVVDLCSLFKPENINERMILQKVMAEGIANGTVRPLTRVVYSPLEVSRAFKLVSTSRHSGRTLINLTDSQTLLSNVNVIHRVLFSKGVNIVISHNSNLAVELVDNLIRKGANNVVLHLEKNVKTNYFYAKAQSWESFNVNITLNEDNLQTEEGCEKLIKAAQKLGSVSSIYIVQDYEKTVDDENMEPEAYKTSFEDTVMLTKNLDIVSRKYCSKLSNFVCISITSHNVRSEYVSSACERICESRANAGLPALVLRAHIQNTNDNNLCLIKNVDVISLTSIFNALDTSLKFKYNNVLVMNLPNNSTLSVDKNLARIFGVKNIDDIDENLTLEQLNVNDMVKKEMKMKLSPVTYSEDEINEMTVTCVKKLYFKLGEKEHDAMNFHVGLDAFYNQVERNEYVAVDAVIPMKTKLICVEENESMDRNGNHLIMIPGFDGRYQVFETMAERLKIRAATLQLGPDVTCDSIPEMARTIAKIMKMHLKIPQKFYILGYSFGVNVALEIAKILETEGRIGVVYCLDSSPDVLKLQLQAYIGNLADTELQNAILVHMYKLMTKENGDEMKQELDNIENWIDKIELCMTRLRGLVNFSNEYRRATLESAYKRLVLAKEYEADMKLESELVLIKGIPHPGASSLADDYNLSKYTKQPVKVFNIESDHTSVPYDCKVPYIVNKMLDHNLLKEFKRSNICDFYYL